LDKKNGPSLAKGELTSEWGEMTSWVYIGSRQFIYSERQLTRRANPKVFDQLKSVQVSQGHVHRRYYRSDQKLKINSAANFFCCSRQQNPLNFSSILIPILADLHSIQDP
jgi:hypothetical protein